MRITLLILCLLLSQLFLACRPGGRKPFYHADISGIAMEKPRISRYEKLLFEVNPFILYQELGPYLEEFDVFLGEGIHTTEGQRKLYDYVTDPLLIDIYLDSRERLPDLQAVSQELHEAFRFYRYHFPEEDLPRLYTYISGIDYGLPVFYEEGHLVIAIDNYLGNDYPLYDRLGIPRYQSHWMRAEFIPLDVMRVLSGRHFGRLGQGPETLLEHMVHEGKKLFFLDCMFPSWPDSLKVSYTSRQSSWMDRNEGHVWAYILDNELLYSADHESISIFISDAPFTNIFSQESAPRTGAYIGWQIVREYMRRNPHISLGELIHESDARKVLQGARYRP